MTATILGFRATTLGTIAVVVVVVGANVTIEAATAKG